MADQTVIPFFRSTYEDVLQDIRTFEVQNHLYFNHSTRQAGFNKDTLRTIANAEKAITIRWKDSQPNSQPFLRDDGYPFYICGRKRLVCHHGPDTKLGSKAPQKEKMDKEDESDHNFQRRRHINQPSKKVDCPAVISIRHIIWFHDFQVPSDAQSRRKNAAKRLKSQIDNGEDVHHENRFYVHFPSHKDHQNHLMGPAAGLCQPMASALKERVRELVHQGVQQPHQVLEHLQIMVMNEIFKGQVPPPRTNAQYWPSYITVYNLIYSLSKDLKNRKTDIPNLENTLDEWQVKLPGLKYHLQTGGVETNKLHYKDTLFLMVMQTAEQRHLLKRYGLSPRLSDSCRNEHIANIRGCFVTDNTVFLHTLMSATLNNPTHYKCAYRLSFLTPQVIFGDILPINLAAFNVDGPDYTIEQAELEAINQSNLALRELNQSRGANRHTGLVHLQWSRLLEQSAPHHALDAGTTPRKSTRRRIEKLLSQAITECFNPEALRSWLPPVRSAQLPPPFPWKGDV